MKIETFPEGKEKKTAYVLPEKQVRAEYVRRNFSEIADTYDLYNDLITFGLHRYWKKKTVLSLNLSGRKNASVLDLCCGSGDLTLLLAKNLGEGSEITALDFSPGMLAVLKKRIGSLQSCNASINVREGDASDLSFQNDSSADGVTIAFGLRNVSDRARTLAEIYRVLKPGARLAVLDTGKVRVPVISFFHGLFFKKIVPLIGHLINGKKHEMYEYLPASAEEYPGQEELKKELMKTGFTEVTYRNFLFGAAVLHTAVR